MKSIISLFSLSVVAFLGFSTSSHASSPYDWLVSAHVTDVEATYMPSEITFTLDQAGGTCAAGAWITWANANADQVKATFAMLLAAKVSGQSILLYGFNSGCKGSYIHLH